MKRFNEFLEEMAHNIGDTSFSPLNQYPEDRKNKYIINSEFEHHSYPLSKNKTIEVTRKVDGKNTLYSTNDNTNKGNPIANGASCACSIVVR